MIKNEMLSLESRQNLDNLMINHPEISCVSIMTNRIPGEIYSSINIHSNKPLKEIIPALESVPGLYPSGNDPSEFESGGEQMQSYSYILGYARVSVIVSKEKDSAQDGANSEKLQSDFTINDMPVKEYLKREG